VLRERQHHVWNSRTDRRWDREQHQQCDGTKKRSDSTM